MSVNQKCLYIMANFIRDYSIHRSVSDGHTVRYRCFRRNRNVHDIFKTIPDCANIKTYYFFVTCAGYIKSLIWSGSISTSKSQVSWTQLEFFLQTFEAHAPNSDIFKLYNRGKWALSAMTVHQVITLLMFIKTCSGKIVPTPSTQQQSIFDICETIKMVYLKILIN